MSNFDLIQLLQSENSEERKTAAEALGKLGNSDAVPALIAALEKEPRLGVAHELVDALGKLGDKRAIPALLSLKESSSKWQTSWSAAMYAHQLREKIEKILKRIGYKPEASTGRTLYV